MLAMFPYPQSVVCSNLSPACKTYVTHNVDYQLAPTELPEALSSLNPSSD